mmetsp:Transcript_13235/g.22572  ORF Transcript_13235/g.22572 Transcript_13235/m.22572 type:complete len:119 (+) Transcript_13235:3069-3425(+)
MQMFDGHHRGDVSVVWSTNFPSFDFVGVNFFTIVESTLLVCVLAGNSMSDQSHSSLLMGCEVMAEGEGAVFSLKRTFRQNNLSCGGTDGSTTTLHTQRWGGFAKRDVNSSYGQWFREV